MGFGDGWGPFWQNETHPRLAPTVNGYSTYLLFFQTVTLMLGFKSVQRESVVTGVSPESRWYSEDRGGDDKFREELKQKSQLLR